MTTLPSRLRATAQELKPCPFCGGEARADGRVTYDKKHQAWFSDGSRVLIAFFCNCIQCGVTNKGLIGHQTREKAIAAWNRRIARELEEAAGALEVQQKGTADVAPAAPLSPNAAALDVETVLERLDFIAGHEASAILRDTAEAAAAMIRAAHGVSVIDTADHVLHGPTGETWVVARVNGKHLHPCGWPPTRADLSDCTLVKKATLAEREQLLRDLSQGQTEHAGWAAGALGVKGEGNG